MKPRVNEKTNIFKHLERELVEKRGIKWLISVQVKMIKYQPDGQDQFSTPYFRSNCQRLLNFNDLLKQYQNCVDKVQESFQTYQREGSRWQLEEVRFTSFLLLSFHLGYL